MFALAACDGAPPAAPNWSTVRGTVATRCATCHQDGGVAPFSLLRLDDVRALAPQLSASITAGSMPPWKAADDCNSYENDRRLTDDEKAALVAFLDAGAPADDGDVDDVAVPALPRLDRVDEVLQPVAPYAPGRADEYRCYAVEWPRSTSTYITGFDFLPLENGLVHHANLFVNDPSEREVFLAREARDPEPGFDCGLGRSSTLSQLLGSYAPGASAIEYPADTGILVEPGAVLVFEVHYGHGGDGSVDQPQLQLRLDDNVAKRALGAAFWNFLIWDAGDMPIPAGSAFVSHSVQLDPSGFLDILAPWFTATKTHIHVAGLHMHQLGRSGFIGVDYDGGRERTCVLANDEWDYLWQEGHTLKTPIPFEFGKDLLLLECVFDNSAENQPVIDGARRPPADRNWGPRTDDEMCMGFLYVVPDE